MVPSIPTFITAPWFSTDFDGTRRLRVAATSPRGSVNAGGSPIRSRDRRRRPPSDAPRHLYANRWGPGSPISRASNAAALTESVRLKKLISRPQKDLHDRFQNWASDELRSAGAFNAGKGLRLALSPSELEKTKKTVDQNIHKMFVAGQRVKSQLRRRPLNEFGVELFTRRWNFLKTERRNPTPGPEDPVTEKSVGEWLDESQIKLFQVQSMERLLYERPRLPPIWLGGESPYADDGERRKQEDSALEAAMSKMGLSEGKEMDMESTENAGEDVAMEGTTLEAPDVDVQAMEDAEMSL